MEVSSTISKTFKRFTIPRSTSSMGSFTTSNGTATNVEQKFDDSSAMQAEQIPPFNGHSTSTHKHPPLSYVQHIRPVQHLSQQNLSLPSQQQQDKEQKHPLPARPLSSDISSFMMRSASTDFHPSKETKIHVSSKKSGFYKSSIQRDMSYDNIKSLTFDDTPKSKAEQNGSQRSSIKSLLAKTFHPSSSSSTTATNTTAAIDPAKSDTKQKKRRTSFRNFSHFLKRSHSTNTDLSTIATHTTSSYHDQQQPKLTADLIYQRLHAKTYDEADSSFLTRSNTSIMCNSSGTALVPISEEENPIQIKPSHRLKPTHIDDEDYYYDNTTRADNGVLTYQQTQRIAPSLSKPSTNRSRTRPWPRRTTL